MADPFDEKSGLAVPADRLSRLMRMGRMSGGLAGRALAQGAGQVARGRKPILGDLLLTPANAKALTDELSRMRGAAMKVGQLISMETADLLPPELAAIFARLRADADPMPPKQLRTVLDDNWGRDWQRQFRRFDVRPIAAASIGQVHRAQTRDGRDLAIKVQYPGVRGSIDSDVRNIGALMRLPGVVPRSVDLSGLLEDARRQLHEEADYLREGAALERFADLLDTDPGFIVPRLHEDLSSRDILAMDFVESVPLDALEDGPQDTRDTVAARLIELVLRELFTLGHMQTDPNFANYRWSPEHGKVVLLDFGATRQMQPGLVAAFHDLMRAGLDEDRDAARAACMAVGLFDDDDPEKHRDTILDMFAMAMEPLRQDAPFDFATSDLVPRLRRMGLSIGSERDFWHVPPTETLFVQRKVAGTYLLAARLGARVNLHGIVTRYR
ncbi:AarF/ABC1/UbiB kinase family protein [Maribius pontilimi]|uniref:AarF/ABC1/UbiB kinase family protein n=1 Tax=Palleronia pontilimi TaxID=1964209 RepID=A0A934IH24_9RHOB|nr:AarF/ABC1/UbiB kinase family protein [Palleronia pontilimi]MBJ3764242.1 AarF/ABC1/UbiB kinase family protein [Palleronia pontilimi]